MEIPAEFRGRVYKFKTGFRDIDPKLFDQIKKDFPDAEIGNLFEVTGSGWTQKIKEIPAIEFLTEEDYTAFMLRYGGNNV